MQNVMEDYKQGEIVWADYPLSDKPAKSKTRPVLVISNYKSNALDNDLLIIPITSRIRRQPFEIVLTDEMLSESLPAISAVRCNKLHTIRNTRITGRLATVSADALTVIVDKVYEAISISEVG